MSVLEAPPKTYSDVYPDPRYRREPHALNVRHEDTVEILRFRTPEEAKRQIKALRKVGYRKAPKGRKR